MGMDSINSMDSPAVKASGRRPQCDDQQQRELQAAAAVPRSAAEGATAAADALAAENATLRAENAAMASELAALSPRFFEEVEDLKYAYATARQQLDRFEELYGALPVQPPPPAP